MSIFLTILIIFLVITFFQGLFTVAQQTVAIIETFGKFTFIAKAGLHFKIPYFQNIAGRLSLRVQQLDVKAETKTHDNVFVHVLVSVQYMVREEKIYEAFYKLQDPVTQINAYVFDVVRAKVPSIKLDDLFIKKDDIAMAVKEELSETMGNFGFDIVNVLVTDIEPDMKVKEAMNEINAAERMRMAATEKGEAERILKVKSAQADAESKALQGKGIADQRKAIIEGLSVSVDEFQNKITGSTAQEVMNLVLLTQYLDTLKEIGQTSNSNTILLPHGPGAVNDLASQIQQAIMVANAAEPKNHTKI
ncbi:MAG TPA: SPFH domain-containing protein [Candidatus Woesebacteria bacterium]|nr:SPFH domain-containing protein [Candidatus Woesebacteria bacterium]